MPDKVPDLSPRPSAQILIAGGGHGGPITPSATPAGDGPALVHPHRPAVGQVGIGRELLDTLGP